MFKRIFDLFKRIFDLFKRDKIKKESTIKYTISAPKPTKDVREGIRQRWIDKLVQTAHSIKSQRSINKGGHIAKLRHILKPMRPVPKHTDFSYSNRTCLDRMAGRIPNRKEERKELGLIK